MKKQLMILALSAFILPAFAQETNEFRSRYGGERPDRSTKDRSEFKKKHRREESTPEQKAEHSERRLQLMKKVLKDIGVSEEQQVQILALQQMHQKKMKAVSQKAEIARENLSKLQDTGASEAELDAAIDAISEAQSEQLKILVRNRMEMERILGKEKNGLFMENARKQFRMHGRHGGPGMPPRPGMENEASERPKPPAGS